MALVPKFTMRQIDGMLGEKRDELMMKVVDLFEFTAIEAVNNATDMGSYIDRTGNLRNSLGYVIAIDGVVVREMFKNEYGSDFAMEVLNDYQEGIVMIVVAGMNYAIYVESRGYNVLSSAEMFAERRLPELLKQLRDGNNNPS